MQLRATAFQLSRILHVISLWLLSLAAVAMVVVTALSALGASRLGV